MTRGSVELSAYIYGTKTRISQNKFIDTFRHIKTRNRYLLWFSLVRTRASIRRTMQQWKYKIVSLGKFCHFPWKQSSSSFKVFFFQLYTRVSLTISAWGCKIAISLSGKSRLWPFNIRQCWSIIFEWFSFFYTWDKRDFSKLIYFSMCSISFIKCLISILFMQPENFNALPSKCYRIGYFFFFIWSSHRLSCIKNIDYNYIT